MTDTRKLVRNTQPADEGEASSSETGGGTMSTQVRAWGQLARRAHDQVTQGTHARAELTRRRNRSGQ
jgi:hypothetical protein